MRMEGRAGHTYELITSLCQPSLAPKRGGGEGRKGEEGRKGAGGMGRNGEEGKGQREVEGSGGT